MKRLLVMALLAVGALSVGVANAKVPILADGVRHICFDVTDVNVMVYADGATRPTPLFIREGSGNCWQPRTSTGIRFVSQADVDLARRIVTEKGYEFRVDRRSIDTGRVTSMRDVDVGAVSADEGRLTYTLVKSEQAS